MNSNFRIIIKSGVYFILLFCLSCSNQTQQHSKYWQDLMQNQAELKTVWEDSAQKNTVTFLHISDSSNLLPQTTHDPAKIAFYINQFRNHAQHTYTTFGGDGFRKTVITDTWGDQSYKNIFDALHFDFAVVGNHELDDGPQKSKDYFTNTPTQWLAHNLINTQTHSVLLDNTVSAPVDLKHNMKMIGLTTDSLSLQTKGLRNVQNWQVNDPVESAKALMTSPQNFYVLLTHLSEHQENAIADLQGPSLVLGGMSLEDRSYTSLDGSVVLETKTNFASLAIAVVTFSDSGEFQKISSAILNVEANTPRDSQVASLLDGYLQNPKIKEATKIVGQLSEDLNCQKSEVSSKETNCGNVLADVLRHSVPDADFAIVSGGSIEIDAVLPQGNINKADAEWIVPFEDEVVGVTMSGADVMTFLEQGLRQADVPVGLYLVSGLTYRYDSKQVFGHRLIKDQVMVQNVKLDPEKKYKVATIRYLADGFAKKNIAFAYYFEGQKIKQPTLRHLLREQFEDKNFQLPEVTGRFSEITTP